MITNNQFQQLIQKEITKLINVPADFKNIQISVNEGYEERQKISIYQMKENSIIITAPCLYDDLDKIISSTKNSKIYIDQLKILLNLNDHLTLNNTIYLFLNPDNYCEVLNKNMFEIIKLDERYEIQYNKLKNKCSKKDINEAMVGLDDPVVFGCFNNGELIAAASYWFWGDKFADIGVIVHPEYRKKGFGKFLVSKLCEWGINNQKINLYRHNELNKNSHFLAQSLNFKEYFYVEEIANK